MILFLIGLLFCEASGVKIKITNKLPPDANFYTIPSQLGYPMGWALENPVIISIPIPYDVSFVLVSWNFSTGPVRVVNPIEISTDTHIIFNISSWGISFPIGYYFSF
jgi:hypothetical protein